MSSGSWACRMAFVPFSAGAVLLRGTGDHRPGLACPASACQQTETVKRRMWLGASVAGPACFVVGMRPVSGAFGWTPIFCPPWGPLAVGTLFLLPGHWHHPSPGAGRVGGRTAAFALFPYPWLGAWPCHCGGLRGLALWGQELWCFIHNWFLSPMTSSLPKMGHCAPLVCPACPRCCQMGSPATSALPRWALGTGQRCHCRRTRGGAEGYFTGYFTCWHQLFLPSARNHIPPPRAPHPASCLPSPPASPTIGHHCSCATFLLCPPLLFPLALALIAQHPDLHRSCLHCYCWVTGGTGQGVPAPQDGF